MACGRPAEPRVRPHVEERADRADRAGRAAAEQQRNGAASRWPSAPCRACPLHPQGADHVATPTAAADDSEELSRLRILGCTEIGASVSGMRFGSTGPTAFNGMLVGIALAVLMFMLGGDGASNVERMPRPAFIETMTW